MLDDVAAARKRLRLDHRCLANHRHLTDAARRCPAVARLLNPLLRGSNRGQSTPPTTCADAGPPSLEPPRHPPSSAPPPRLRRSSPSSSSPDTIEPRHPLPYNEHEHASCSLSALLWWPRPAPTAGLPCPARRHLRSPPASPAAPA
nr:lysine-rich arabinogalactan protein 19-like [Aegilops tauschii subsp. strangulata]